MSPLAEPSPAPAVRKRRKAGKRKAGTALAIIVPNGSEAHVDAKPPSSAWGGARNRGNRVSSALPLAKAEMVIAAAYRAVAIGLPFNRFVTIHFERAGLTDAEAISALGTILKLAADWMRSRGAVIAHAWVRENDAGDGSKGSHVHILCHCPDTLPIGRMWQRWLRKATGNPYRTRSIKSARVGGTLNCHATSPALYRDNLDRVLAYVVKGVSPADAAALGLPRQADGGQIIGKRAGVSQNARAQSGVLPTACAAVMRGETANPPRGGAVP